jgi:prevent-host-death family protein
MTRLPVSKAREDLADALNRVAYRGERIVLERRGKRVAAIVSVEDLDLLEELEDQMDLESARKALADVRRHGTVPWEKVKTALRQRRG